MPRKFQLDLRTFLCMHLGHCATNDGTLLAVVGIFDILSNQKKNTVPVVFVAFISQSEQLDTKTPDQWSTRKRAFYATWSPFLKISLFCSEYLKQKKSLVLLKK